MDSLILDPVTESTLTLTLCPLFTTSPTSLILPSRRSCSNRVNTKSKQQTANRACDHIDLIPVQSCDHMKLIPVQSCDHIDLIPVQSCDHINLIPVQSCDHINLIPVQSCDHINLILVQTCMNFLSYSKVIHAPQYTQSNKTCIYSRGNQPVRRAPDPRACPSPPPAGQSNQTA